MEQVEQITTAYARVEQGFLNLPFNARAVMGAHFDNLLELLKVMKDALTKNIYMTEEQARQIRAMMEGGNHGTL
jgi:IS1 family transposase